MGSSNRPVMPRRGRQATRNLEDFQKHLTSMGIVANAEEAAAVEGRMRSRSRSQASANGMEMDGAEEDGDPDLDDEEEETVAAIRNYKGVTIGKSRMNESSNRPVMPRRGRQATRNLEDFQKHLTSMGIVANAEEAAAVE